MSKFTKGDVVRCTALNASGGYRYNNIYTVKDTYYSIYSARERIHTEIDSLGSTSNGWGVENFELAEPRDKPITTTILGTQVGGSHYTDCAIQPIEYIWANKLGFSEGNVVKYITRWKTKGGIKDLEKAKHHIALLIEHETTKGQGGLQATTAARGV